MKHSLLALLLIIASLAGAKDLGFRYTNGVCQNALGQPGLNPAYFGQCGDLRHVTMQGISLEDMDLSGSEFLDSNLETISFARSNLTGTKFNNASVAGAVFDSATIHQVDFTGANAKLASFIGADISQCTLVEANFSGAVLSYLDLTGNRIESTEFSGAKMDHVNLSKMNFGKVQMRAADLTEARMGGFGASEGNFRKAIFRNAKMQDAVFTNAQFSDAVLIGADLSRSNLSSARLYGANLKDVITQDSIFTSAHYGSTTILPFDKSTAASKGLILNRRPDLLVIWDWPATRPYAESGLLSLFRFIESFDHITKLSAKAHSEFDGTEDLSEYGTVLHLLREGYLIEMPAAGQSAIMNFINKGGMYLVAQWASIGVDRGMLSGLREAITMTYQGPVDGKMHYTFPGKMSEHPLAVGLGDAFVTGDHALGDVRVYRSNPATVVAVSDSGSPLVIVRNLGQGISVNFAFVPSDQALSSATIQQLILNAMEWR